MLIEVPFDARALRRSTVGGGSTKSRWLNQAALFVEPEGAAEHFDDQTYIGFPAVSPQHHRLDFESADPGWGKNVTSST